MTLCHLVAGLDFSNEHGFSSSRVKDTASHNPHCPLCGGELPLAALLHTSDSAHKQVPLRSRNADYMDSLHEPVNTLARIWWWPPEDGSLYDPKHVGAKWILHDFNVFFYKYVHELVTVDNVFIDVRFNYETEKSYI